MCCHPKYAISKVGKVALPLIYKDGRGENSHFMVNFFLSQGSRQQADGRKTDFRHTIRKIGSHCVLKMSSSQQKRSIFRKLLWIAQLLEENLGRYSGALQISNWVGGRGGQ